MGLHFALRSVGLESVENAARKFVSERQRECFKSFKNASDRIDSLVMASKFHSIADLFYNLSSFSLRGSGCCSNVEQKPQNHEVMGSNPAGFHSSSILSCCKSKYGCPFSGP